MKGNAYLLVKETADILGIAPNTVRKWARDGKLKMHRHPVNGYRLFKKSDVQALLRKINNPPPDPESRKKR